MLLFHLVQQGMQDTVLCILRDFVEPLQISSQQISVASQWDTRDWYERCFHASITKSMHTGSWKSQDQYNVKFNNGLLQYQG